ncbi:MAG TPA: MBL fold metallo-hydrolase [Candidatus Kapabacteria bacterium]|nr:MBL fold metallo-hydrolase [Candidatus Kapabacteria bacterium]
MFIFAFESGPLATIAYIAGDETTGRAVIIDAPKDCTVRIKSVVEQKKIAVEKVLLTHTHWDHTADAAELKNIFHAPVCVHKNDEYRLLDPRAELIQPPFPLAPLTPDAYLEEDQKITVGGLTFHVLFTPGHTEGSVCFYERSQRVLFSGDTLFAGSVGRTDLRGGSWEALMESLHVKVLGLPDDVTVYPGHGPMTTIGTERMFNPFLTGEIE